MMKEIQDMQGLKEEMGNIEEPMGHIKEESFAQYNNAEPTTGGKKKRRKGLSKKRGTRSTKKRVVKRKTTRKKSTKKKGPSKWIMHVKAFCKKTGKNFPEALKDPMCRKTFKH